MMNGILNLDKPSGMTSHDCIAQLRRATRIKRMGHAGTLDPLATGVLLVCIGQATRLSEYLMGDQKVYRAEFTFGITTDTQDSTGTTMNERDAPGVTEEAIRSMLPRFTGDILQVPPMVSALHHQGQRLYDLARQGVEVDREARPITIYDYKLLHFALDSPPRAEVEITCSAGTYIRTLAYDMGEALGCGAHMSALRRTRVGPFAVDDALPLERAVELGQTGNLTASVTPMSAAVSDWPVFRASEEDVVEVRHGRDFPTQGMNDIDKAGMIGPESDLIALGSVREGRFYPFKVFV